MEYRELSQLWQEDSTAPKSSNLLSRKLINEAITSKVGASFKEQKFSTYFELISNILWMGFLVSFMKQELHALQFFIPALILGLASLLSMGMAGYQLWLYHGSHSDDAVLDAQRKVMKLQYLEALDRRLLWLLIPVLSTPFLIVLAKSLAGIDMYLFPNFLWQIGLGSIPIAAIIVWILKRFPSKKLQEARDFLDELDQMKE